MPDVPAIPDIPELPTCLPGSCDALWNAVDKGMAPITGAADEAAKGAAGAMGKAKDMATRAVDTVKDKAAKTAEEADAAVKRNTDMARAYAQQYLNDAKQAWAGVAGVMAQQAGCAAKDPTKLGQYVDDAGRFVDKAVDDAPTAAKDAAKSAQDAASGYAKDGMDALAATQKSVFETIYPVTKFYEDNGLDKLKECGSIPGRPEVPAALTDALEQIDKGTDEGIRAGSDMIAQFEQNQIVEKAIYEAERYRDAGMNEMAAMTDKLKSGLADAMPMSSGCGGPPLPFDGSLLDPGARERYYHTMMNQFETMGKDARDRMMNDIAKQAMP